MPLLNSPPRIDVMARTGRPKANPWVSPALLTPLSRLLRDRLPIHAAVLLCLELGFFAFLVAGAHGAIVPLDRASSTDFVSFYAAGVLAQAGTPWLAYDQAAHFAAEQAAAGAGIAYNYFYYPPIFLTVCAQLARKFLTAERDTGDECCRRFIRTFRFQGRL